MTATALNQVASDNADLLDKVYLFLTTNADLITAGEAWVSMEYVAGTSFILKGVGLGGTDEIYIGWRIIDDVPTDVYNIEIRGFGGYINGNTWDLQPFAQPYSVYLCSYNLAFNYWIIANGRRFIVIEKISTSYLSSYCGFMLPYATPTQYPYPLVVSASTHSSAVRWSATSSIEHAGKPVGGSNEVTSGYLYTVAGWLGIRDHSHVDSDTSGLSSIRPYNDAPWKTAVKQDADGGYTIFDAYVLNSEHNGVVGLLDGYGWVSGYGQLAENTVTFGGDTWLVIQDVYRTTVVDYYAVRLL